MDFGTIESITIGKNLDTGEDVRLAQVNLIGEDTVTVELPFPEGDEFAPATGDKVFYEEADSGYLVARCIQSAVPVDSSLGEGERELFSRSSSARQAKLRLKNNGELVLNEGNDYAVKFEKLEAALDLLASKVDTNFKQLKAHSHVSGVVGGPTGPPMSDPGASIPVIIVVIDSDISTAKVPKVRL